MSRYKVLVDDNFHYMREDERYELGTFSTAEDALAAAKRIIDRDLDGWVKTCATAEALYEMYVGFGEDPFILPVDPNDQRVEFSAWGYAKSRCQALYADQAKD